MAMRGSNSNVKTLALLLVAVGLVALEQSQQAQATHCCCHLDKVPAYFDCRSNSADVTACCQSSFGHISNDKCEEGFIDIEETALQAVNYCKLGCTASLCNKSTPSVAGGRKDAIEGCISGCHELCTKNGAKIAKVRDV